MSMKKLSDDSSLFNGFNGHSKEDDSAITLWKLVKNLAKSRKNGKDIETSEDLQKMARMCSHDDRRIAAMALHYVSLFMKQMSSPQKIDTLSQVMLWCKRSKNVEDITKFVLTVILEDYWSQKLKGSDYEPIYGYSPMIRTDPLDFLFTGLPDSAEYFFWCISSLDWNLRRQIFGHILERFIFARNIFPYSSTKLRLLVWKDCVYQRGDKYLNHYFLIWNQDYDADMLSKNVQLFIESEQRTDTAFLFALNAFVAQCRENTLEPRLTRELLKLLKTSSSWAQVIGATFLVLKTETILPAYLPVYLEFFERVMLKENVPSEILLLMLAAVLPIKEERSLPPPLKLALDDLKTNISEALKYSRKIKVDWSPELMFNYALHSHCSFLEARQLILLLLELKNKDKIEDWLRELSGRFPKLRSLQLLLYCYFHFGSTKQKTCCLKMFKERNSLKFNRCLYQCKHETDPLIKLELLEHLFIISKTEEERNIVKSVAASFEMDSRSQEIMLRKLTMILHLNRNFINYWPPSFMTWFLSNQEILSQIIVIEKLLESRAESFQFDFTSKINFILNNWTKVPRKDIVLPVTFKCLNILCEKGIISIPSFWEPLVKRFGSSSDPIALKSLFSFLAIVPRCIIPKTKDPVLRASLMDELGEDIIYKSARVLWHFVKENSKLSEDAARALMNYELDNFDSTFLGPECSDGHSTSRLGGGEAFTPHLTGHIGGRCWICLLESAPQASALILFKRLIEKHDESLSPGVNIRNLYDNLASYFLKRVRLETQVNASAPENRTLVLCMNLLGAEWKLIGRTHIKPDVLFRLIKNNERNIQEIVFRIIRVQCVFSPSSISAFNDWAISQNISGCQSLYLLVVPKLLRHRLPDFTTINRITEKGLNQYLFEDKTKCSQLYDEIVACLKDHEIQPWPKTNVLQTLLKLWFGASVNSQGVQIISQLLAMFKRRLVSSLPLSGMSDDILLKMIQLCEDAAIRSRSLNAFSKSVEIGLLHEKFRGAVISSLKNILSLVPSTGYNYSWVCNFIQTTTCKNESEGNFLFEVLVISADRISTTSHFSVYDSFMNAVDRLPIALHEIIASTKRSDAMIPLLTRWLTDMRLKPAHVEALVLSVINLKNSSKSSVNISDYLRMFNLSD